MFCLIRKSKICKKKKMKAVLYFGVRQLCYIWCHRCFNKLSYIIAQTVSGTLNFSPNIFFIINYHILKFNRLFAVRLWIIAIQLLNFEVRKKDWLEGFFLWKLSDKGNSEVVRQRKSRGHCKLHPNRQWGSGWRKDHRIDSRKTWVPRPRPGRPFQRMCIHRISLQSVQRKYICSCVHFNNLFARCAGTCTNSFNAGVSKIDI